LPFLAILCGWTVTEVGRQPYLVYGHLRTADAVSPVLPGHVETSLALFFVAYSVLLLAFFWYATRLVLRGPTQPAPAEHPHAVRPGRDSAPAGQPAE
jgi:cytochrome d ubiquinol oxidase subunit I